jgi:hypothetical protein
LLRCHDTQVGALWKACTHSEANRNALLANGLRVIESLAEDAPTAEIQRASTALLVLLQATKKSQEQEADLTASTASVVSNDEDQQQTPAPLG